MKPDVKPDPQRLFRDTQVIQHRKAQVEKIKEYQAGIGRGNLDMKIDGEQLMRKQHTTDNDDLSFNIMNKLAEKGLLGTAAGQQAFMNAKQVDIGARFQGWALKDNVKGLFGVW